MKAEGDFLENYFAYLVEPSLTQDGYFHVFLCIHSLIMLVLLYFVYKKIKIARVLIDTPTSKVRSAAQGFVEIKGRCKQIAPLYSPLTNTSCTCYTFQVEQLQSSGNNKHWETIEEGVSPVGFYLYYSTRGCLHFT